MEKSGVEYEPYRYATYPRPVLYSGSYNKNYDWELSNKQFHGNIMYDKRIVRGNTWALRRLAKENAEVEEREERKRMKQKRQFVRKHIIQSKSNKPPSIYPNLPDNDNVSKYIRKDIENVSDFVTPANTPWNQLLNEQQDEKNLDDSIPYSRNESEDVQLETRKFDRDIDSADELKRENELDEPPVPENQGVGDEEVENENEEESELRNPNEDDHVELFENPEEDEGALELDDEEEFKEETPSKSYSEFQCQVDIMETKLTADKLVQSDLSWVMDEFNEAEMKRALRQFVDTTLLDSMRELEKEVEIDQLRREHELVLNQRERDLDRLQRLVVEVKSVINEKEALMTRVDELEQEKLKLISRQLASEIIQSIVGDSLDKLTINGYIRQPTTFVQLPTYDETKLETIDNVKNEMQEAVVVEKETKKEVPANDELQSAIAADFFPWLNAKVWGTGSKAFLSKLLDDVVKLRGAYCRGNAKKFLQSTLETFDEAI